MSEEELKDIIWFFEEPMLRDIIPKRLICGVKEVKFAYVMLNHPAGITRSKMVELLGVSKETTYYYVRKARKEGLISTTYNLKQAVYKPTSTLRKKWEYWVKIAKLYRRYC